MNDYENYILKMIFNLKSVIAYKKEMVEKSEKYEYISEQVGCIQNLEKELSIFERIIKEV